jgi:hypothetical protein
MVARVRPGFDPYDQLLRRETGAPSGATIAVAATAAPAPVYSPAQAQRLAEVFIRFNRGEQPRERGGTKSGNASFSMAEVQKADAREKAYRATLSPADLAARVARFQREQAAAHQKRRSDRQFVASVTRTVTAPVRAVAKTGAARAVGSVAKTVTSPAAKAYHAIEHTAAGRVLGTIGTSIVAPVTLLVPGAKQAFSGAVHSLASGDFKSAAKGIVSTGTQLAPVVQSTLKNLGPIGMAASAAVGALSTAVQGGSLEDIGWAAAEGAAPTGIDNAIKAAHELRRGGNVANALMDMGKNLIPGTEAAAGFGNAAKQLAATAGASPAEAIAKLGAARRAMPSAQARAGFDLAVGTVSRSARNVTQGKVAAGPRIQPVNVAQRAPMVLRTSEALARGMLEANPQISQEALGRVAAILKVNPTTARRALAGVRARYRWRPLSNLATKFVSKHAPMAARVALKDTRGLSDGNTVFVVESGQGPIAIGNALFGKPFGDQNWKELIKANPQKSVDPKTGNFKFLAVGERLKLPATWVAKLGASAAAPAIPASLPSSAPAAAASGVPRFVSVLKNEGPSQIAIALTGDGGAARINELRAANMPKDADGRARKGDGQSGFSPGLNPGDRLFVPASWPSSPRAVLIVGASTPAPAPVLPSIPSVPAITPPAPLPATPSGTDQDTAAVLQAKAILAAWGKTDGVGQGGLTDYGQRPEDLVPTFGSRDGFMLANFSNWSNRTQGTKLATGTQLLPEHVDALRAWAEKRAQLPLPPVASPIPAPVGPIVTIPPAGAPLPPTTATPAPKQPSAPAPEPAKSGGGGLLLAVAVPLALTLLSK